jgi:septum formation protein
MAVPELVLASASPRRRELIGTLGVPFRTFATDAEEELHAPAAVLRAIPACPVADHDHPTLRAWRKADAAQSVGPIVLGADTIVVLEHDVLNKPELPAVAQQMLRRLAGRDHTVFTGLALLAAGQPPRFALVESTVRLMELSDEQIAAYVDTGEPLDKAGGYGVQGLGGQLVQSVVGSFTNVVGLPLTETAALLRAAGLMLTIDPLVAYQRWVRSQGKEPLPCPPTLP